MDIQKINKRLFLFLLACCLCLSMTTAGCFFISTKGLLSRGPRSLKESRLSGATKDKILVIDIKGLISEKEKRGLYGLQQEPNMVTSIKEQLDKAAQDRNIKGLLLVLDSPGGTVTASDILYKEIKRFKNKNNVEVMALFSGTATSGAYYLAQAADRIIAYPTAVTGSIGVILLNINFNGLMNKIGVSNHSIKSGPYKDLGSPFKVPVKEETDILQGVVNELYGRFCEIVKENRHETDIAKHPELTDGRIFTAKQALEAGLIDEIGYFPDAVNRLEKAAGISQASIIRYDRLGDYRPNIYAYGRNPAGQIDINLINLELGGFLSETGPSFMYLWLPGS